MALTVPDIQNIANASTGFDFQALVDEVDFLALSAANAGTGVYSGCLVVPNATPNYGASVDAGYITINGGMPIAVAGASVAVPAASSTDRRDIIVANSAGAIGLVEGTPCGTSGWIRSTQALGPIKASAGASCILGEIAVPGGAASVAAMNASCILDKRVMDIPSPLAEVYYSHGSNYTTSASTIAAIDSTNLAYKFVAPPSGRVRLKTTFIYAQGTAAGYCLFGLLNNSGGAVVATTYTTRPESASGISGLHLTWLVTGLSYGTAYQYNLAYAATNGDTLTVYATGGTITTVGAAGAGDVHLIAEAA